MCDNEFNLWLVGATRCVIIQSEPKDPSRKDASPFTDSEPDRLEINTNGYTSPSYNMPASPNSPPCSSEVQSRTSSFIFTSIKRKDAGKRGKLGDKRRNSRSLVKLSSQSSLANTVSKINLPIFKASLSKPNRLGLLVHRLPSVKNSPVSRYRQRRKRPSEVIRIIKDAIIVSKLDHP